MLLIIAVFAGISLCSGQPAQPAQPVVSCPQVQYNPPSALKDIDVLRVNGIWYEYAVSFTQTGWNIVKNGTVRGAWTPGTSDMANKEYKYAATWWINYYIPVDATKNPGTPSDTMKCTAIWHHGNMTTKGKRYAMSIYGDIAGQMANISTTVLFTDYNTVEIVAGCDDYPAPTNGICAQPLYWVFTRVKPPTLTASQKDFVNKAIDRYLKPMCKGFSDMKISTWDLGMESRLVPCNIVTGQPQAFPWPAANKAFEDSMPPPMKANPLG